MRILCISSFFSFKSGLNYIPNFFLFDSEIGSERVYGIMFKLRPPVKMFDFHGEVTFIGTVYNEASFLAVKIYINCYSKVQIYIDYCSNVTFTIQM
jgi:hypothetical protein